MAKDLRADIAGRTGTVGANWHQIDTKIELGRGLTWRDGPHTWFIQCHGRPEQQAPPQHCFADRARLVYVY